jgi:hypothetical protein
MKTKHQIMGIAVLLVTLSFLAKGQIPLSAEDMPRRTLGLDSAGEVVVMFEYTNRPSLTKDSVPSLGESPRTVVVKSGGEVLARVVLTNHARVSWPTGRFQILQGARSVTYQGDGLITLEIESTRGNSFKLVAEEIELLQ